VYYSNILRIVTTYPLLAKQRPSISDIKQEQTDYSDFFEESENVIQQLTYALRTRDGTVALIFVSVALLAALWLRKH